MPDDGTIPGAATAIDRSSPLPFYVQLKRHLSGDIRRRGLAAGDRLSGDHELCQMYGVSRTVVRQALWELEAEGVIQRVKGRGTFIAPEKTGKGLVGTLTGLFDDVSARGGGIVKSQVFRQEIIAASPATAQTLHIQEDDPVIVIERLRFIGADPVVYTTTYISAKLAPTLVNDDLSEQSLYALLRDKYGLGLMWANRSLEALLARGAIAQHLGLPAGDPLLLLRNVTFDAEGEPVEMFVSYHRADLTRFEVRLEDGSQMRALSTSPDDRLPR